MTKGFCQTDSVRRQPIDANFLFHYYEQDGIHSAVTGGNGTEELTDRAGHLVLHIPIDTAQSLDISTAINTYTSASTDKIDSYVSSASRKDSRFYLQLGYNQIVRKNPLKQWGIGGGVSVESDYISTSVRGYWSQESADGNTEWGLNLQAFFDTWIVIFPEELRAPGLASVPTDRRRSFNLAASWSRVINQRLQASLSGELIIQQGLLSTPFHRVYFQDESLRIEKLPGWRVKTPLGLRLNYFATDLLVLRGYYRFYSDSFGLLAHTFSLETPIKPTNSL
ncbi:MAG: DUF3570 domain-containing protein, partial [Bacteroidota bacterium]